TFHKYTDADGLHLGNSEAPGITAVAGGLPRGARGGYEGSQGGDEKNNPTPLRRKLDPVLFYPHGKPTPIHYDVHNDTVVGHNSDGSINPAGGDYLYNVNRSVRRFLYDHLYHRGTLYVGFQHGIDRIDAGKIDPTTGLDYADHKHPMVTDSM